MAAPPPADDAPPIPSLWAALMVWATIGLLSFGGPAGQIALMHRELVERRRWISDQRFLHALNYCMLLPGPEAQQLAIYIGWLMHRTAGGLLAGLLFIIPGALVMLGLSILYTLYHTVPLIDALFFGVKAAVLAVVIDALRRIAKRALTSRLSLILAGTAFAALAVLHLPFPMLIGAAGLAGYLAHRLAPPPVGPPSATQAPDAAAATVVDRMAAEGRLAHTRPSWRRAGGVAAVWLPIWLAPIPILTLATGGDSIWSAIGRFFASMAVVTFGGAYAVLAYVGQASVETFHWLSPDEMIDGLGLAETTPGPLILVLQFVGFLAANRAPGSLDPIMAGCLGALLCLWVTFAPCFLWVFLGGPSIEAVRGNRMIGAALSGITAAIVGVILNLAVWFGLHVLFKEVHPVLLPGIGTGPDLPDLASLNGAAALLSGVAILALFRFKIGMMATLALTAGLGMGLRVLGLA